MSGFLYFLPDQQASRLSGEMLAAHGLSHIIDRRDQQLHARDIVANGPGGLRGVVIGAADRWQVEEVKQSPALEWVRFPKAHADCQAWMGWVRERPLPKPAELARSQQLPGEWLTLADGEKWLVPIARDFEGDCQLPLAFDLDDETGEWVPAKVRNEYQKIWNHAQAYLIARIEAQLEAEANNQDTFSFVVPDGHALTADALAANYRVSQRELATLGVLVTGIVSEIANVLIDAHSDHFKKKRDEDTGNG
jgi:hypothetical protein